MYYYEVAVDHKTVRGKNTLTYSHTEKLSRGDVVQVPLRSSYANGIVISQGKKPAYTTKPLKRVLYREAISEPLLKTLYWIQSYYGVDLAQAIQLALPRGAHKKRQAKDIDEPTHSKRKQDHTLTKDQENALHTIRKHPNETILVHGVTGSGKTRVYIEAIKDAQNKDLGCIVLVPEIGLTSQMVSDIRTQFDTVFVLHSQLTENNRHVLWERIQKSDNPIVIGPRSALFAPIKKLGLIVIDEEHEQTYKQDQAPKYNAIRVASMLRKHANAQLLLGSATPSIEDYNLAKERKLTIVKLKKPVFSNVNKTTYEIIDLKDRQNFKKGNAILSDQLLESLELVLSEKQQAIIFLNRRGSSTSVICTHCGWHAECPNCLLPLTHHSDWQMLVCHICNYRQEAPLSCPNCNEPKLQYKGFGTKQIAAEISKIFPNKKVIRFDADTKKGEQLLDKYNEILEGKIDIIVGTQTITKGLDLPNLGMVGIVLADSSLYLPDYSANERTFQLLSQVIGRVGRHGDGRIVIQTYSPDNPVINLAATQDYESFFEQEIEERKRSHYPPFTYLLKLTCERVQLATVQKASNELALKLRKKYPDLQVLGPSPALHEKTRTGYRWQLVIKSAKREPLLTIIQSDLPANWQHEIDPLTLL